MKFISSVFLLVASISCYGVDAFFKDSFKTLSVYYSTAEVCVSLDSLADSYPVVLNLEAVDKTRDSNSHTFNITLEQGDLEGCEPLLLGNVPNTTQIVITGQSDQVDFVDGSSMEIFQSLTNLPPFISLSGTQAGIESRTFFKDQGNIVVSSIVSDLEGDDVILDWSGTDNTLVDLDGDANNISMTIDPAAMDQGVYTVKLGAVQSGSLALPSVAEYTFRLLDSGTVSEDADLDGIADVDEVSLEENILSIAGAGTLFETPVGTRVVLGDISFSQGLTNIIVGYDQFEAWVDDTVENTNSIDQVVNFIIEDIDIKGAQVLSVLKLVAPLDSKKDYYKYRNGSWGRFSNSGGDNYYSAESESGECPAISEILYSEGLLEGNDCILLKITDGGANDSDGVPNGVIKDPGGIGQVFTVSSSGGGAGGSDGDESVSKMDGGSLNMPFLLFLISLLGFKVVQRK